MIGRSLITLARAGAFNQLQREDRTSFSKIVPLDFPREAISVPRDRTFGLLLLLRRPRSFTLFLSRSCQVETFRSGSLLRLSDDRLSTKRRDNRYTSEFNSRATKQRFALTTDTPRAVPPASQPVDHEPLYYYQYHHCIHRQ